MVLPGGVSKSTGLQHALEELGLGLEMTCAVGDAENDLALLGSAGCGVAVANALESVKSRADIVTQAANGHGVQELCQALVADDLASMLAGAREQAG